MVTEKKTFEKLQEKVIPEIIHPPEKKTFEELQEKAGSKLAELIREEQKGNATKEDVFEAYRKCDALELARLVRDPNSGVTQSKLLEIALDRNASVHPNINAVIHLIDEKHRKPEPGNEPTNNIFKGVPFLIKDSTEMKDVPFTHGSNVYKGKGITSVDDSEIVKRFKDAGLVIFGKTNMPEFGNKGVTEPEAWGATRNPWNLEYSPGGSSGGSAAAVAAGIVSVAQGSDQGGSIRIPASCTGLFGLIPTNKDIYTSTKHVISRSVRDSAAMLDVIQGSENHFQNEVNTPPNKTFKIMYWSPENNTNPYREYDVHEECLHAVREAVKHLEYLGHTLINEEEEKNKLINPLISHEQYDRYAELLFKMLCLWMAKVASKITSRVKEEFKDSDEDEIKKRQKDAVGKLELETRFMAELGKEMQEEQETLYNKDIPELQNKIGKKINENLFGDEHYDLYLTPTLAKLPPKIGEITPKDGSWEKTLMEEVCAGDSIDKTLVKIETPKFKQDKEAQGVVEKMKEFAPKVKNLSSLVLKSEVYLQIARVRENLALAPWTLLAYMAGNPAMSVPLHWTGDGIPVGVEFMAKPNQEYLLFRLAGQLERQQYKRKKPKPWFDMVPQI